MDIESVIQVDSNEVCPGCGGELMLDLNGAGEVVGVECPCLTFPLSA